MTQISNVSLHSIIWISNISNILFNIPLLISIISRNGWDFQIPDFNSFDSVCYRFILLILRESEIKIEWISNTKDQVALSVKRRNSKKRDAAWNLGKKISSCSCARDFTEWRIKVKLIHGVWRQIVLKHNLLCLTFVQINLYFSKWV